MSRGLISFLGGMGQGGLAEYHRQKALERQDRLDAQQKRLIDLREQQVQMELDKRAEEAMDRQTLRDAASPVAEEEGFMVQDAFTKDSDAAGVLADMASAPPGQVADGDPVEPSSSVRVRGEGAPKFFGADESGLSAARAYAAEQNEPDAWGRRVANAYSRIGNPEKSIEFTAKAEAMKEARYQAGLKTLYRKGLQHLAHANYDGLTQLIEPHLPEGSTLKFTPGAGGGGTYDVVGRDGNRINSFSFKTPDEAMTQWGFMVYPEKKVEAQAAAAAEERKLRGEIAKERAKEEAKGYYGAKYHVGNVAPGHVQTFGGRPVFQNTTNLEQVTNPDGSVGWVERPNGGRDEKLGAVMPVIEKGLENQPDLIPHAESNARELLSNNPGMSPAMAADLAIKVATGQMSHRTTFNPATAMFTRVLDDTGVKDGKGNVVSAGSNRSYSLGSYEFSEAVDNISLNEGIAAVRAIQQSMKPDDFAKLAAIKTPEAQQQYIHRLGKHLEKIKADAMAAAKGKSPEEVAAIDAKWASARDEMQSALRRMVIVSTFHGRQPEARGKGFFSSLLGSGK